MSDIYDGAHSYMFKRVLNRPLQLYLFNALLLKKKVKVSLTNTSLLKDFSVNTLT